MILHLWECDVCTDNSGRKGNKFVVVGEGDTAPLEDLYFCTRYPTVRPYSYRVPEVL